MVLPTRTMDSMEVDNTPPQLKLMRVCRVELKITSKPNANLSVAQMKKEIEQIGSCTSPLVSLLDHRSSGNTRVFQVDFTCPLESNRFVKIIQNNPNLKLVVSGDKVQASVLPLNELHEVPKVEDWTSFFKRLPKKLQNSTRAGMRPDTLILKKLPISCFTGTQIHKPSLAKIESWLYGNIVGVSRVLCPFISPLRRLGVEYADITGYEHCGDGFFVLFVQFNEYERFKDAMDKLRHNQFIIKDGRKTSTVCHVKVDFDRSGFMQKSRRIRRARLAKLIVAGKMETALTEIEGKETASVSRIEEDLNKIKVTDACDKTPNVVPNVEEEVVPNVYDHEYEYEIELPTTMDLDRGCEELMAERKRVFPDRSKESPVSEFSIQVVSDRNSVRNDRSSVRNDRESISPIRKGRVVLPKGRVPSPKPPSRRWHPSRLDRPTAQSANDPPPNFNRTLSGEGEILYLGPSFSIIRSGSGANVFFENHEALWPKDQPICERDWVAFKAVYWPKVKLAKFNCPEWEATEVQLLDHSRGDRRISQWMDVEDVRDGEVVCTSLSGYGRVYYKGGACSLMRDQKSGQHIFMYNHVCCEFRENQILKFEAHRNLRYIGNQRLWTQYDAVSAQVSCTRSSRSISPHPYIRSVVSKVHERRDERRRDERVQRTVYRSRSRSNSVDRGRRRRSLSRQRSHRRASPKRRGRSPSLLKGLEDERPTEKENFYRKKMRLEDRAERVRADVAQMRMRKK